MILKILIFILLIFQFSVSNGQEKSLRRIIERDTINLRGKVVDIFGKPVPYIGLTSKATDEYDRFFLGAQTNSEGLFEIKGAFLNDTIQVESSSSQTMYYYNKGSRFITIQQPPFISKEITAAIKAKRLRPKQVPHITKFKTNEFVCALPYQVYDASYPGGAVALQRLIAANLEYPKVAIVRNIEGQVKIRFRILKDGSAGEFTILDGLGYGCDEEALRVLKLQKKWWPAVRNGRPVESEQTVSIFFSLEN